MDADIWLPVKCMRMVKVVTIADFYKLQTLITLQLKELCKHR